MTDARPVGGRPPRSSREEVVDVGLEILRTEGLAAVTLGAIGERLGLGKVALYTYVASKDDLLHAMRDEVYRQQLTALTDDGDLAPEVALKAMCSRLVRLMTDYGPLVAAVDAEASEVGLQVGERFLDVLAGVGLAPRQQLQVYVLLTSLVNHTVQAVLPGDVTSEVEVVEHARETVAHTGATQFPRLQALLSEAVLAGPQPLASLTDDVLALIIDVLIPAITRPEGP